MTRRHDTARRHVWTAEQRTRLIIESVKEYAIFMLDPDGVIVSWSPGAEQVKGYRADEIIGRHFSVFYPPGDDVQERCDEKLRQAAADGRFEEEGWRLRKDGSRFWASVVLSAVRSPDGELVGFAKVTRDLTERRKAEEEHLRLARAEEAIRLRDAFLSIASHELKTPLTGLLLDLQVVAPLIDDASPAARKIERALRSTRRLNALVDALLDVSRITTGRFELEPIEFDLAVAAREMLEQFDEESKRAGAALTADVPQSLVGVWDKLRVEQIFTNLLTNAIKYGGGAGVHVQVRREADEAVLVVSDAGPGFPDGALDRVFARFEQAGSHSQRRGLGLGLYVVREIARAHGGTAVASNRPEGGAAVTVRLPFGAR